MWRRNLFFLGVVFCGMAGLAAALFPSSEARRAPHFRLDRFETADIQASISRINDALHRQWAAADLTPAPRADDFAIARRLSLGLTGRIPSLQEIRQLEKRPAADRLQWWLAGILDDRRFADYVAERFARAWVGTEDGPFIIYRRRRFVSWLSDRLHERQPYDAIVRALITSEGLWTDNPATNFLTVTAMQGKSNQPDPERLAGRVTRAFLGIRLDCAQCHNHPYEKWQQADFRGLAAYFGQARMGFAGIHDGEGEAEFENRTTGAMESAAPHVPFLENLVPTAGTRRQQLAGWIAHRENPYFARAAVNRVWALMLGRPIVEPVDDIPTAAEPPELLRLLADDFAAHGYDLGRLVQVIVGSDAFSRDSAAPHDITDAHEQAWAAFPLTRLRPEQVAGAVLQSASLTTLNADSPLIVKFATLIGEKEFLQRYGDTGEDEFSGKGGTIPQRLLLMNGKLVYEKTREEIFNAATRIGWQAPDDAAAVRTAYLVVLTRLPTLAEARHFEGRLGQTRGPERARRMEDLFWALINSTEFAWNH